MREDSGSIRTGIQGWSGGEVARAGERGGNFRGNRLSIWLNMLHNNFKLGLLWSDTGGFGNSPTPYTFG